MGRRQGTSASGCPRISDTPRGDRLRWGELVGRRRCFVDSEAGSIQIRGTIIQVHGNPKRKAYPKSAAGCRTIPMSARAAHALKWHLERHPAEPSRTAPSSGMHDEELVFRGERGRVLGRSNFWRLWTSAGKAAGVARQVENPVARHVARWPHLHDVRTPSHRACMRLEFRRLTLRRSWVTSMARRSRGSTRTPVQGRSIRCVPPWTRAD
jgi:hypothetical protein